MLVQSYSSLIAREAHASRARWPRCAAKHTMLATHCGAGGGAGTSASVQYPYVAASPCLTLYDTHEERSCCRQAYANFARHCATRSASPSASSLASPSNPASASALP